MQSAGTGTRLAGQVVVEFVDRRDRLLRELAGFDLAGPHKLGLRRCVEQQR
jgi:hypothetical protein